MKVDKKKPRIPLILLALVALVAFAMGRGRWDPPPEMPSRDLEAGHPMLLALETEEGVGAPLGHSPSDRWRTHHREAIARGDFTEAECQDCHDPDKYCNQCHGYVGVRRIEPESATTTGTPRLARSLREEGNRSRNDK